MRPLWAILNCLALPPVQPSRCLCRGASFSAETSLLIFLPKASDSPRSSDGPLWRAAVGLRDGADDLAHRLGGINAWTTQRGTMMLGFPEWVVYSAMVPPLALTCICAVPAVWRVTNDAAKITELAAMSAIHWPW